MSQCRNEAAQAGQRVVDVRARGATNTSTTVLERMRSRLLVVHELPSAPSGMDRPGTAGLRRCHSALGWGCDCRAKERAHFVAQLWMLGDIGGMTLENPEPGSANGQAPSPQTAWSHHNGSHEPGQRGHGRDMGASGRWLLGVVLVFCRGLNGPTGLLVCCPGGN